MKPCFSRTLQAVGLLLLVALLTGCVMAPVVPPLGGVYTNLQAPLDLDSHNGKVIGEKKGEASSVAILGLFAFGDAGIRAACKNGGLEKVTHVDYRYVNVLLGVFCKYTTIVYGE